MRTLLQTTLLLALTSPCFATTHTVLPDGTGDFPTIQAAIDAAVDGDIVALADGVFTGPGNRDIDLLGKEITVRSQNGYANCVIDCEGTGRGFLLVSGETALSVLQGLTVTHGWSGGEWEEGGAVQCDGSSPTLTDCAFVDNQAHGGGALTFSGGAPSIEGCLFEGNLSSGDAADGGAIRASGTTLTMSGCTFRQNEASAGGGAVACWSGVLDAADCAFEANTAESGGALAYAFTPLTLTDCAFTQNSAASGGATLSQSGTLHSVSACLFAENTASSSGGGMRFQNLPGNAVIEINGCSLVGNSNGQLDGIDGDAEIANAIIAFAEAGPAVTGSATATCCDIFGNAGGDWTGDLAGQLGLDGNFSEDPRFCDPVSGDYTLEAGSPCLPGNHPQGSDCGVIGALGEGCPASPVEATTWGGIKAAYR